MNDWYLSNITVIQSCLVTALLAMSLQVTMRVGILSFAGVGFYGIGAYGTGILVLRDVPWVAALIVVAAACAAVSYLMFQVLSRVRGIYFAMVTLGFVLVMTVVAANGGDLTGGVNGLFGVPLAVSTTQILLVVLIAVVVCFVTERGHVGRQAEALRTDELLASASGIDIVRVRRLNFALSGVLGSAAGGLNVLAFGTVNPYDAGFPLAVAVLTAVVIGGQKSWVGAVLGGFLVTALPTILSSMSGTTRNVALGAVVVVLAMYAPDGLHGIARSTRDRYRRVAHRTPPARRSEKERSHV